MLHLINATAGFDDDVSTLRAHESLVATIAVLVRTLERRDPFTAGHQSRVARLAAEIGQAMGLEAGRLEGLRVGALLHDIGNACISQEVLDRPEELTLAERGLVQAHAEIGYDILKEVDFPWPVARMVLEHHERVDGSGYPSGLKGEEILLEARIIAVADVVQALTSARPFRPAFSLEAALYILRERGAQFDARVVDACCSVLERNPGLCRYWSLPRAA